MVYISLSELDTRKIARRFASESRPGDIFCLDGELGSGKTVFAQEFAKAIGIKDYISSPTFNIVNEYYGVTNLYHFDVYRICDADEMEYTNYQDYFYGDGICLIEWAKNIEVLIPKFAKWIKFSKKISDDANYRVIEFCES